MRCGRLWHGIFIPHQSLSSQEGRVAQLDEAIDTFDISYALAMCISGIFSWWPSLSFLQLQMPGLA